MRSESDKGDELNFVLSTEDALKLVSSFLDKEWAQTDISAVRTRSITDGLMNALQLVQRSNIAVLEPSAVLIRHFGRSRKLEEPAGGSLTLSSAQQAIVYWGMARRGWDPRSSDSFTVAVRKMQAKSQHVVETLLKVEDPVTTEYASMFGSIDWKRELKWVSELFQRYNCKTTVTHGDANYLNILVKNFESECRVALIDYETVSYSYRGIDIGAHFHERMYCYNQPDSQLTGFEAPNLDEQRLFCEAYLQEMRDLGEELSELDTIEHLVLEAEIGRLCHILVTNLMCTVYDEAEIEPLFLSGLLHAMGTYEQLKRGFLSAS